MSTLHPITQIALAWVVCPYCDAYPGDWCRTQSGRRAGMLHTDRKEPVRLGFVAGRAQAEAEEKARRLRLVTAALPSEGEEVGRG